MRPDFTAAAYAAAIVLLAACSAEPPPPGARAVAAHDSGSAAHAAHATHSASSTRDDSAFAALQRRGADPRAMGVDQYTSVHRFDALSDGGRIELQRAVDDSAGVAQIRRHLREIAAAFAAGNFETPAFVHTKAVPGTAVMAAKPSAIVYTVRDLPRGAELRITTRDPVAVSAVHEFMAFQRMDHHAGGADSAR
jgi:hypothetical protein